MSNYIQGKNAILFGYLSGVYYPIGCEIEFTYEYLNELTTKTDVNAGSWRKYEVRISDCTASLSGVTTSSNGTTLSIFYYLQEAIRRTPQNIKMVWTDDDGVDKVITGVFMIKTINIANAQGDWSKFTLELQGTSGITIDPIIGGGGSGSSSGSSSIDENITADYWLTVEGATSINGLSVGGLSYVGGEVILVSREGATQFLVTGTPGNEEAQVSDPAGTNISFLNPFGPDERVYVIWLS